MGTALKAGVFCLAVCFVISATAIGQTGDLAENPDCFGVNGNATTSNFGTVSGGKDNAAAGNGASIGGGIYPDGVVVQASDKDKHDYVPLNTQAPGEHPITPEQATARITVPD